MRGNKWISVNDENPPFATYVKVLYEDGTTDIDMKQLSGSYCCDWGKLIYNKIDKKVTHWQLDEDIQEFKDNM